MTDSNILANQKQFLGHPVGLYILFLTEMWERFSYYGMRAILVLYLVGEVGIENAGLGWSNEDALALYGWYTMFVYVASIPGGIIADKILGQKKSVFVGGMLLVAGHSVLAIEAMWAFYTGLTLIVMGVGMLKPNISTMVGGLYPKNEQDKRDMGFYIFYMGINLGAAASALLVGYIGETIGWHYGFGLAGIGMAFGQLTYWYGQRYLTHVGNLVVDEREESEKTDGNLIFAIFKSTNSLVGFILTLFLGIFIWQFQGSLDYGLLVMGLAFAVGVGIVVYNDGNKIEKDRILVTYLAFLIVIVFWGSFEQAGGLLNVYAAQKTDLVLTENFIVPASWFQSVNAIFILIFATIVGSFWVWWKNRKRESSSLFKMAIGVIIMGWGFFFMSAASMQYEAEGLSSMHWLVLAYLFHTIGELCASPVALSFITKLAPDRWMAFMMGAYFAATGLGNKVAGLLGESATEMGEFAIFTGIAIFCTIFGLLVLLIIKPLKRLTHNAEGSLA
ncbi:MAG: peptide MFS transporter [Flavobacteriaceae bacterium]|jgi:proton-dependent oligopeptide transporter, POT family|nr:peptide MFS transporter [Flavobacteriaceae bacterium]MBT4113563.1 peptide MFS transporter [Flavobacteriaceae bacterium]MBT4614782.1 peptide MFS transporter [Flavobacteriaceae bacterium]MBT5246545.1 peptide MFS transporter [Flavobacteriaceae bacterium]MBT5649812.1 peptide MFS transporter [Flavobacteriaceae bacterium]